MFIARIHADDNLARDAVRGVLNRGHDKRIRQKTLNFYRSEYSGLYSKGGHILFLVGYNDDNEPIAMSACAHGNKTRQVMHSITVVHPDSRRLNLGKKILQAKMEILRDEYDDVEYRSFVSKTNEASIKMCSSVGLMLAGEGSRDRGEGKEPTEYFIFEDL